MPIYAYHRPSTINEVLALLHREDVRSVVIGGGTVVNTLNETDDVEVVDLQHAAPASIERRGDQVTFGAMARLQDMVEHPATPPLLAELARREGPSTFRNAATLGGTVASAGYESELLAGLLVFDATLEVVTSAGTTSLPLAELLADRGALAESVIIEVSVPMDGATASARTGRTPSDTPIVAAVGRVAPDGVRLALTGVAAVPVLVDEAGLEGLHPPADFRGSSEYRRELAGILFERVMAQLESAT